MEKLIFCAIGLLKLASQILEDAHEFHGKSTKTLRNTKFPQ